MTGGGSARTEKKTGEQSSRCCLMYLVLEDWKTCNINNLYNNRVVSSSHTYGDRVPWRLSCWVRCLGGRGLRLGRTMRCARLSSMHICAVAVPQQPNCWKQVRMRACIAGSIDMYRLTDNH